MGLLDQQSFRLFLGVALVIYGCWNSALGMAFIKQSSDTEQHRRCICRPRFWIGTLILLGNSAVVDMMTFSLLPISMIAPFAGLTIVFSLTIASTGCLGPKETITLTDAGHIGLVLVGVTVVSLFGPHSGVEEVRYEETLREFKAAGFILYAAINLGIVTMWVAFTCVPAMRRHLPSDDRAQGRLVVTIFSAYAASTCGALSKLFMKVVAAAARQFFSDDSPSNRPGPFGEARVWAALVLLCACAILQLYLLNATLASSTVGIAVPMYQATSIVLTILAGGAAASSLPPSLPPSRPPFLPRHASPQTQAVPSGVAPHARCSCARACSHAPAAVHARIMQASSSTSSRRFRRSPSAPSPSA